ncbi:MAG: hypothetical protein JOZ09_08895, partial [Pseudonocardiales bacterium]|nr:hypothetical protein [Pseudonocardiales bacterium]
MLLVTQVAALDAITGTAAVEPTLSIAFQMPPRVRTSLMLGGPKVADLIDMADPAVLVQVPIWVLHVAVVLPMIVVVPITITHTTVIPTIPITITHTTVIPTIPITITHTTVIPTIPITITH